MTTKDNDAELKVSAHVLIQLGEELVTDVEQAILECVKNAYDADSRGCKIKIRTKSSGIETHTTTVSKLLPFFKKSENVKVMFRDRLNNIISTDKKGKPLVEKGQTMITRELHWTGKVVIEDTGDGLSPESIRSSWLVISNSSKRATQGKKAKTKSGRTPLGDKGLGRLGSMKLGDLLLIESSKVSTAPLASALFRWSDCEIANTVDEIPVRVNEDGANDGSFKGTRVSVLGLRDIDQWSRPERALEITKSLARLISPFEARSKFPVTVDVDGHKSSLVAVTETLLSRSIAEFEFFWELPEEGVPVLKCRARFRDRLFNPIGGTKKQKEKAALFDIDKGEGFLKSLLNERKLSRFKIVHRPSRDWFIELNQDFSWQDIVPTDGLPNANPGPLTGAFYYFHVNDLGEDETNDEIDGTSELDVESAAGIGIDRKMIKEMAGVSILRDGFRVRSPGDWLKMSEGMTSGSTYNLRFHNTLGYFALTGEYNFGLIEKSDREGFVDNAEFRGFQAIAEACKMFANEAIENIRRAQDNFVKKVKIDRLDDIPHTPEGSLDLMEGSAANAASAQENARTVASKISEGLELLETNLRDTSNSFAEKQVLTKLKSALSSATKIQKNLETGNNFSTAVQVLRQELTDNKDRMLSLYESAAVGLSARGLAHELRTHLFEIRKRTTALEHLIKTGNASEIAALPHVRAIRSSLSSISNAASLIDPLLPRARAVKELLNLREFVQEYIENRQLYLDKEDIKFVLKSDTEITVRMNRGRLLQVLDNLVRNSVYWLRRGTSTMGVDRPKKISVSINSEGFMLMDSGPGVDPNYENSIFEMFVTAKPAKERGQGLGLFIVTQLLAADGGHILLAQDRNRDGRRYKFVVNLNSVIEER